ncbi:MAG: sodium/proton-translocating pyrophosphatase, partial [Planctomycetaceae bacterium]
MRRINPAVVRRMARISGTCGLVVFGAAPMAFAAEGDVPQTPVVIGLAAAFAGAVAALVFAFRFYKWMVAQDEGDATMIKIAEAVRQGAWAYLRRQYTVVALFFVVMALVLAFVSFGLGALSRWVPFAFLTGGFFSGLAGLLGMKTATLASSRTTQGAKTSLNQGLQIAFRSGAVMGLTVVGLVLFDITVWFAFLYWGVPWINSAMGDGPNTIFNELTLVDITVTMLSFGMGASIQALFARVGGGIFTKAADVGADLVGKVEAGIPEDDPRNPATIADNVGDNVGDVAGMGADLYESYAGSILASMALGVAAFRGNPTMQVMLLLLPMVLAAAGIGLSIGGIFFVRTEEGATQKNLLAALARGINASSVGVILAAFVLVWLVLVGPSANADYNDTPAMPQGSALFGVFWSIVTGLAAGWIIGKWTEYSTSSEYSPTKKIADQAVTGPATVIIAGVAEGFYSVWVPILSIGVGIMLAFGFATGFVYDDPRVFAMGLYGVGIAAVGMLSTLGITLATDAYGPIADNAGGNAEMSHQDPIVRERTDALDSLGNTTAATGKGFAIGSAALTALALLAAYVEEVRLGFDHWVLKVPAVTASPMEGATVRKLSDRVLVYRPTEDARNQAWLVFPRVTQVLRNDQLQIIEKQEVGAEFQVDLQSLSDDGKVIAHNAATIPDFVRFYNVTIMNPVTLVGIFLGVLLAFVFCAMTMKAVGRAAGSMVEEVRRQFRENPGIMQGTSDPDYASCVAISTAAAQREMIAPALLGLLVPILGGMILGVGGVMGMLVGALTSGFAVAIMMANAGGAWDNAKKY